MAINERCGPGPFDASTRTMKPFCTEVDGGFSVAHFAEYAAQLLAIDDDFSTDELRSLAVFLDVNDDGVISSEDWARVGTDEHWASVGQRMGLKRRDQPGTGADGLSQTKLQVLTALSPAGRRVPGDRRDSGAI